ncbi:hypothetical protein [Thermomonospora umbrina]|uniref:Uncharacterized protein n=1 Tax=Thermomonospora umbrina TaxID=111806 RepID=A0A3D9SYF9_9ACTN|nr:hypothetical protein [Thermomonospora umbrina]REE96651.1 hypothetical protein DFJ69_2091 [Thermomonospora umbrina]
MSAPPGVPSDAQIKHLEFIQNTVARLAGNSFLAKGWALTISAALYGVSASRLSPWIALAAIGPTLGFWWLDSYFLQQERLFRCLYNDVRKPDSSVELFSMDTSPYRGDVHVVWRRVFFSSTLRVFYGALVVAGMVLVIVGSIYDAKSESSPRTKAATSSILSSD